MENWVFNDKNPNYEPLFVAQGGRILCFALRPREIVCEHQELH
jgi:hypothetical protein